MEEVKIKEAGTISFWLFMIWTTLVLNHINITINKTQAHEVQMTATVEQSEMRKCIEEVCGYEFK
jgi:hypothetical protein